MKLFSNRIWIAAIKKFNLSGRSLLAAALATPAIVLASPVVADQGGEVTISHYFTGEFGQKTLNEIMATFEEESGYNMKDSPVGHEDYKTDILVRAAGQSLPDVFSYWAGARTQFVSDAGGLQSIDEMWKQQGLDNVVTKSIADSATIYNGKRYLAPIQYHYAGLFYNKQVLDKAGFTKAPTNWEEFLKLCETLKSKGITPIALGSKNRWPAQFWFDYLLLQTAGPDYREKLMTGQAQYDDAEVKKAMGMWKELADKGYFLPNSNADSWTDASDKVARGKAAMTLMGTWITSYWNSIGLIPGEDYDFFAFPQISPEVPTSVVGPAEGFVISANAKNVKGAEAFLAYMTANSEAQAKWTKAAGAITANVNVDLSEYNELMQRAYNTVSEADNFAFNYDLSTPPPVAEVGLSMFARFMDDPSKVDSILAQVAADAESAFKQ